MQVADVLLGACLYEGQDQVKREIADEVKDLKNSVSNSRFDEWEISWRK